MALLSATDLTLSFGGPRLLDGVSFTLDRGERICLLGRNGEGKSTLMKVLSRMEDVDAGSLAYSSGARVAYLPQEVPRHLHGKVRDLVEASLGRHAHDVYASRNLGQLFSRLDIPEDADMESLSGGQKRRVLLASALAQEPDLLLLDEPTNHLDLESIAWMEQTLKRFQGALLFVSHDRAFLRTLATRIFELDRGRLWDWNCDYDRYLSRREERMQAEEKQNALEDKKLAQEEVWIRQGVKARRTRNEGRVRALKALREQRRARRERSGTATLTLQSSDPAGQKVVEVKNLSFGWGGDPVVQDFSTLILRGDKIGLIGPNGCGKTTLLNLLLGNLSPQAGTVAHGTRLEILYFDQLRLQLDEEKSLVENVGEGSDHVLIGGQRRHVISYLEDFLFSPARSRTPVKVLSGGERNRLLLAKLFTKPSNVLVMDEPTNDLDLETLELLEDLLVRYDGTLLLVSHDRDFLNEVVTSTLVFEGEGKVREFPGGYDDWLSQRSAAAAAAATTAPASSAAAPAARRNDVKRLTNWEEKELKELPAELEALERSLAEKSKDLQGADFYRLPVEARKQAQDEVTRMGKELTRLYERWTLLEERSGA